MKNQGRSSRQTTSDICPNVILNAGFGMPASRRNTGTYAKYVASGMLVSMTLSMKMTNGLEPSSDSASSPTMSRNEKSLPAPGGGTFGSVKL